MAKSLRQRALSRERLERMTKTGSYAQQAALSAAPWPTSAAPWPAANPAINPFDNYEDLKTHESTQWRDGERYPRFILHTHSGRF